jgi:hypothetical protein
LDTAVNFYYLKKQQRYNGTYFRDTAVTVNSSTLMLLDTARYEQAAITYTFSPEGFASKNGEYLVAGASDGTILLTATIAETTNYEGQTMTATVVIGTGVNVSIEKRLTPAVPFIAKVNSQDLDFKTICIYFYSSDKCCGQKDGCFYAALFPWG